MLQQPEPCAQHYTEESNGRSQPFPRVAEAPGAVLARGTARTPPLSAALLLGARNNRHL